MPHDLRSFAALKEWINRADLEARQAVVDKIEKDEQMSIETAYPKLKAELLSRRAQATTDAATIASLHTQLDAIAAIGTDADALVADASAHPVATASPAKPLASDLYSRIPSPAQVAEAAAKLAAK